MCKTNENGYAEKDATKGVRKERFLCSDASSLPERLAAGVEAIAAAWREKRGKAK